MAFTFLSKKYFDFIILLSCENAIPLLLFVKMPTPKCSGAAVFIVQISIPGDLCYSARIRVAKKK